MQICIFRYAECDTVRKTVGEPVFPTDDTLVPGIFVTIKRPFLPDKMQKRDIKTPPAWRINIHASTERPCTDPDLHLSLTRVSVVLTPGS